MVVMFLLDKSRRMYAHSGLRTMLPKLSRLSFDTNGTSRKRANDDDGNNGDKFSKIEPPLTREAVGMAMLQNQVCYAAFSNQGVLHNVTQRTRTKATCVIEVYC